MYVDVEDILAVVLYNTGRSDSCLLFTIGCEASRAFQLLFLAFLSLFFIMATSSSTESIYAQCKHQWQANFLAGRGRSANRLHRSLEISLVESAPVSSGSFPPSLMYKRGYPQILCGLKATLYQKSRSHKNITGKFTVVLLLLSQFFNATAKS